MENYFVLADLSFDAFRNYRKANPGCMEPWAYTKWKKNGGKDPPKNKKKNMKGEQQHTINVYKIYGTTNIYQSPP